MTTKTLSARHRTTPQGHPAVVAVALFPLPIGLVLGAEFVHALLADAETLAQYPFGTENGWHYRSRAIYLWTCFAESAVFLTSAALLALGGQRGSTRLAVLGALIGTVAFAFNQLVLASH